MRCQITKNSDGNRVVSWYDWKSFLGTLYRTIPNITSYVSPFSFWEKSAGIVFSNISK